MISYHYYFMCFFSLSPTFKLPQEAYICPLFGFLGYLPNAISEHFLRLGFCFFFSPFCDTSSCGFSRSSVRAFASVNPHILLNSSIPWVDLDTSRIPRSILFCRGCCSLPSPYQNLPLTYFIEQVWLLFLAALLKVC